VNARTVLKFAWVAAGLIGTAGLLGACSRDAARTEAVEAQHQTPEGEAQPPFEDSLVPALRACDAASALAAMAAPHAPTRAAGALCAARVPCAEISVNLSLVRLADDTATAAEYTNRGPIFGSGDQKVLVAVNQYAVRAAAQRRMTCPSS